VYIIGVETSQIYLYVGTLPGVCWVRSSHYYRAVVTGSHSSWKIMVLKSCLTQRSCGKCLSRRSSFHWDQVQFALLIALFMLFDPGSLQ